MTQKNLLALALSAGFLAMVVGCSGGDFPTAKASGTVVHNGQPLADVVVEFIPKSTGGNMAGKAATGRTDESGAFVLSTYQPGDGAVVGTHTVTVSSEDPNKPLPGRVAPDAVFEVKRGGPNQFVVELVAN